ncbi:hypothetical protein [Nonomuraea sp. NPDC048826]|uniref:hypothetical protein n=1 Tax=Nonomuraea sp. NPDC048826 TaxID=3364347 RepID=UPI00372437C5
METLELINSVMPYVVGAVIAWLVATGRMGYAKGTIQRPDPRRVADVPVPAEAQERARELAKAGKRVAAVKEIRQATGLPLQPALDVVAALRQGIVLPVEPGEARDRPLDP